MITACAQRFHSGGREHCASAGWNPQGSGACRARRTVRRGQCAERWPQHSQCGLVSAGLWVVSRGAAPGDADTPTEPCGRPTLVPSSRAGKSSSPDALGCWPRKAATSPKLLSVLAFREQARARFAGRRLPLTAFSALTTPLFSVGVCTGWPRAAGARSTRNDMEPIFDAFCGKV